MPGERVPVADRGRAAAAAARRARRGRRRALSGIGGRPRARARTRADGSELGHRPPGHQSRQLDLPALAHADLVLTMEHHQVAEVIAGAARGVSAHVHGEGARPAGRRRRVARAERRVVPVVGAPDARRPHPARARRRVARRRHGPRRAIRGGARADASPSSTRSSARLAEVGLAAAQAAAGRRRPAAFVARGAARENRERP